MTAQEFADFCAEVDNTFNGDLTDDKAKVFWRHVADLDVSLARAAVNLLVEQGQVWMPTPGEMRAAVRMLVAPGAPPFSEAWPVIAAALDRHGGRTRYAESPEAARRARTALVAEVAAQLGEGPARWVERTMGRLMREPVNDPEHGGKVIGRLGKEYEESCRQTAEDGQVGLALERAGARSLGDGRPSLRRLDPVRLVPQLPAGLADSG